MVKNNILRKLFLLTILMTAGFTTTSNAILAQERRKQPLPPRPDWRILIGHFSISDEALSRLATPTEKDTPTIIVPFALWSTLEPQLSRSQLPSTNADFGVGYAVPVMMMLGRDNSPQPAWLPPRDSMDFPLRVQSPTFGKTNPHPSALELQNYIHEVLDYSLVTSKIIISAHLDPANPTGRVLITFTPALLQLPHSHKQKSSYPERWTLGSVTTVSLTDGETALYEVPSKHGSYISVTTYSYLTKLLN